MDSYNHFGRYILNSLFAENLCNQFEPKSGPTKCRAWSRSKLFYTLKVFFKEFFKKVDFEKKQQMTKSMKNYPRGKELGKIDFQSIFNSKWKGPWSEIREIDGWSNQIGNFCKLSYIQNYPNILWASSEENLSLGFLTRSYPNQPAQLQRLARKVKGGRALRGKFGPLWSQKL